MTQYEASPPHIIATHTDNIENKISHHQKITTTIVDGQQTINTCKLLLVIYLISPPTPTVQSEK